MARNHLNRRFYEKVTTDCISSQEGILWSASQEAFLSSLVSWDCAEVRAKWRCKVPLTQPCMLESPPRESMSHVPWRQGREVWGGGVVTPRALADRLFLIGDTLQLGRRVPEACNTLEGGSISRGISLSSSSRQQHAPWKWALVPHAEAQAQTCLEPTRQLWVVFSKPITMRDPGHDREIWAGESAPVSL